MKELQVKGTQNFLGFNIPVIEGGFGENQKVILAKTVAEIHGEDLKRINQIINRNRDEFEDGIDILDLKGDENFEVAICNHELYTKNALNRSSNIYLLSEQGYFTLVMLMKTDKAKEIRKQLRREYFAMREIINSNEQLKAQLLLSIYNGGQEGVLSAKQLTELEVKEATKPLLDKIEEDKPKVDYYEQMLATVGCRSTTDIAKDYGLSVQKLNKILHEQDIQYKSKSGQWLLYRKHDGKGYTQTSRYITKNNETKYTTKWTQLGQLFIYNILKDLGIHPNK